MPPTITVGLRYRAVGGRLRRSCAYRYTSMPRKPPPSYRTRRFSLLHPVMRWQREQLVSFPISRAVSNVSLWEKWMGEGNHSWQCKHRIETSVILGIG